MWTILIFIVVGMVAGWAASLLIRRDMHPTDWGVLFIIGIAGSLIAGILINLIMGEGFKVRPGGVIGSIVVACLLLWIYTRMQNRGQREAAGEADDHRRTASTASARAAGSTTASARLRAATPSRRPRRHRPCPGGRWTSRRSWSYVSRGFEIVGVMVLVIGFALGSIRAAARLVARVAPRASYDVMRRYFGRSILLGLEILVAADLIRTVAVDPTWQNVVVLGLIVLIRTFLSFSLEVEMDGVVAVASLAARQGVRKPALRPSRTTGGLTCISARAGAPGARPAQVVHTGPMTARPHHRRQPRAVPGAGVPVRSAVRSGGGGGRRRPGPRLRRGPLPAAPRGARRRTAGVAARRRSGSRCATPTTPRGRTPTAYTAWYAQVAAAAREAAPQARLVLGGPAFSIFPSGDAPRPARSPTAWSPTARSAMRLLVDGVSAGGHRRAAARGPGERPPARRPSAPVFPGAGRYRTAGVQTRARLPARLRLLHLSAAGGHATAPTPARGGRRRDGAAAPRSRHGRAVRRRLVVQRRRGPHGGRLRGAASRGAAAPELRWRTSRSPATCSRA